MAMFRCGGGAKDIPEMTISGRLGSNIAAVGNDVVTKRAYLTVPNIGYTKADITATNLNHSKITTTINVGTGTGIDISSVGAITMSVTSSSALPQRTSWYVDYSIRLYN